MVNSVMVPCGEEQVEVTPVITGAPGVMENSLPDKVTLEHRISLEKTTLSAAVLQPNVVTLLMTGGTLFVITAVPPEKLSE